MKPGIVVAAAGFDQRNIDAGIFGQPVCQNTTGRTGADNYIIKRISIVGHRFSTFSEHPELGPPALQPYLTEEESRRHRYQMRKQPQPARQDNMAPRLVCIDSPYMMAKPTAHCQPSNAERPMSSTSDEAAESAADAHQFRSASESYPIDRRALAAHLDSAGLHLDEDVEIQQFATGLANINYRLSVNGRLMVLRRPPSGDLPPGAHDMKREHHILSRLHKVHPLAPQSLHLCEDTSVLGVPFQIIEYRPGLVIKGDDRTPFDGRPERAAAVGEMLIETLVSIHRVDVDAIGLGDFGKPGRLYRTRHQGLAWPRGASRPGRVDGKARRRIGRLAVGAKDSQPGTDTPAQRFQTRQHHS